MKAYNEIKQNQDVIDVDVDNNKPSALTNDNLKSNQTHYEIKVMFDKLNKFVNKFQNKVMIDKISSLVNRNRQHENVTDIEILMSHVKLDKLYLGSPYANLNTNYLTEFESILPKLYKLIDDIKDDNNRIAQFKKAFEQVASQ